MTRDEIIQNYNQVQSYMAMLFISVENYIKQNENVDNPDEDLLKHSTSIRMHMGHAMGELVEAKENLMDLNEADKMCKAQYEKEMNEALDMYSKTHDFTNILDGEDDE